MFTLSILLSPKYASVILQVLDSYMFKSFLVEIIFLCRGCGFISLENLLYFSRTFPVTLATLCHRMIIIHISSFSVPCSFLSPGRC